MASCYYISDVRKIYFLRTIFKGEMCMEYIKRFEEVRITDVALVGGKNASLGEMITQLGSLGVRIPSGFAITADAYWYFLESNHLVEKMKQVMEQLTDITDVTMVQKVGKQVRELIMNGTMPDDLTQEICQAYDVLSQHYKNETCDVAVRSSATAEDLPTASFAGQQETFLNICGVSQLLQACKECMASLFTDRAIVYRVDQGFDHFRVALSVGVQKMIRSDLAASGVAFSLDTESGFRDVVMIESSYGLGESIVQGVVTPDEFMVHKQTLEQGFKPIIKKQCGDKKTKIVYAHDNKSTVATVDVTKEDQQIFSLTDDEILELATFVVMIEKHYTKLKGSWSPMDIEWAKDGGDGLLYIIQARPETVSAGKKVTALQSYVLQDSAKNYETLVTGLSVGQKIVSGVARVITSARDIVQVQNGDIIVTRMTDPDWVPVMKRAAGIITDHGGRTCHAAIVSRELGIAAVVGTENATSVIRSGDIVTIDCSQGLQGYVYKGKISFTVNTLSLDNIKKPPVAVFINCANPASAFQQSFLPVSGVGLARIEFIISSAIGIHPMALVHPEKVEDKKVLQEIEERTARYKNKKDFFVMQLAQGIGMIAAAFYLRPVYVRFSDFKSNEYRNLLGGSFFELEEENPMIGFRGASRYYDVRYKEAFALECQALQHVRNVMGLRNVAVMVPFVRTVEEAHRVVDEMARNGLQKGVDDLRIIMMCEIPSNVLLIDKFCQFFDGFSIGSNDLTQLVLGIDRDSQVLSTLFDERNEAVKKMMAMAIEGAHAQGRFIGVCGQAPSDYPEIADFLIAHNIDSLSLNADSVIPFLTR